MKSTGGLLARIVDRENLVRAVWLAARGRREQPAVRGFIANLEAEIKRIGEELHHGRPECGHCDTFTIFDPKERIITAPVFRERVLHHAVMAVCGPVLESRLPHHSYACRTGKGTLAAVEAARRFAQGHGWFVKMDVRKFFDSIPRDRLAARVCRLFREATVQAIFDRLIDAYEPGRERGLPIGTLVSQHLANFYLSALDTHILQDLRPAGYVRYMDDMALWTTDRHAARTVLEGVSAFISTELGLELKTGTFINRSGRGMDFLGHRVFPCRIGLNRASRRRFQCKARALHAAWVNGSLPENECQQRGTALTAFTQHAACLRWRRRVVRAQGETPTAGNGCCVAGAGTTTAGTPAPRSATTTTPATGTTTSASGPPQLQQSLDGE